MVEQLELLTLLQQNKVGLIKDLEKNRSQRPALGKWKTVTFFPPAAESAPRTTAAAAAAPRAQQSSFRCQAPQAAASTAKSRGAYVPVTDQVVS